MEENQMDLPCFIFANEEIERKDRARITELIYQVLYLKKNICLLLVKDPPPLHQMNIWQYSDLLIHSEICRILEYDNIHIGPLGNEEIFHLVYQAAFKVLDYLCLMNECRFKIYSNNWDSMLYANQLSYNINNQVKQECVVAVYKQMPKDHWCIYLLHFMNNFHKKMPPVSL